MSLPKLSLPKQALRGLPTNFLQELQLLQLRGTTVWHSFQSPKQLAKADLCTISQQCVERLLQPCTCCWTAAHLVMFIYKATPVQQLDGSLKTEHGVAFQQLLLLLRHVACPLCQLCTFCALCPGKELEPLLYTPQISHLVTLSHMLGRLPLLSICRQKYVKKLVAISRLLLQCTHLLQ